MTVPPVIAPVAANAQRPLWSVMIPTYNCARFLAETLRSVLEQDPGPEVMQIEVVDDASSDRPEEVVASLGAARVAFVRQPVNRGAIATFNACVSASRGHLVHVLHGDDFVLPGFYRRIAELACQQPTAALLATRAFYIDEGGVPSGITARLRSLEQETRDPAPLLYRNDVAFAAVVIRRSFYEASGGFRPDLAHTADWEMWFRAVTGSGGIMLPEPLACYRVFDGNDTSRLRRSAENLRGHLKIADVFAARAPEFEARRFRSNVARLALEQAQLFEERGDEEAARVNMDVWRELTSYTRILKRTARAILDGLHDLRMKLVR